MSAYVVDTGLLDAILTKAIELKVWLHFTTSGSDFRYINRDNAAIIGQQFVNENYFSVNHLYRGSEEAEKPYRYVYFERKGYSLAQIAKFIDCLAYQSCEHDGWLTSQAYHNLNRIRADMLKQLPGYEEAKWGKLS